MPNRIRRNSSTIFIVVDFYYKHTKLTRASFIGINGNYKPPVAYKGMEFFILTMHPEIEAALTVSEKLYSELSPLNAITLQTATRLLNYIADINLERKGKFIPTTTESLYMLWSVEDWEFHMECIKNGQVVYSFCKAGYEQANGNNQVDDFIPKLEKYLLLGVA